MNDNSGNNSERLFTASATRPVLVREIKVTEQGDGLTAKRQSSSSSTSTSSPSPKKSARLAEKRKLREEAGPGTVQDDEYYFTPYKSCRTYSSGADKTQTTPPKIIARNEDNISSNSLLLPSSTTSEHLEKTKDVVRTYDNANNMTASETKLGVGDDSSEDDKWFDTLDVGKLDEGVDIDDISTTARLLTERQKSFIFKKDTGFSIDIDNGIDDDTEIPKELATTSASSISISTRKEKSERRRVLANMKKEYDKKRTVDRLLKKPQMKLSRGAVMKSKYARAGGRMITYVKRRDTNSISFPVGLDISVFHGLHATKTVQNPLRCREPPQCGVEGCTRLKKYTCSKTGVPLCSLECYKNNLKPS